MRMKSVEEMVREFHEANDVPSPERPCLPTPDRRLLRKRLISEEYEEFHDAWVESDLAEIADALADLVYVCVGCAIEYGIPFDEVFAEVHRSNMTKLGADGKPVRREDGKIIKGPNFEPPRIREILARRQA